MERRPAAAETTSPGSGATKKQKAQPRSAPLFDEPAPAAEKILRQYRARRPFLIGAGTFGCCSIASRKSSSSATVKGSRRMGFRIADSSGAARARH